MILIVSIGNIGLAQLKRCTSCDAVFVGGESTGGLLALFLSSEHDEVSGILTLSITLFLTMLSNKIGSPYKEVHWMGKSTHCVALDKEREKVAQITMNFISKVINTNPIQRNMIQHIN